MSPDHWSRLRSLVDAVLEAPSEERTRLLDEACRDEPSLRAAADSLLAAIDEAGSFLDRPLLEPTAAEEGDATTLEIGERFGAYRLEELLGHGGMGNVYLARRADQAYEKQVAIKLLRPGLETAELLHRFHRERQILAQLDHPAIAKLLDGGSGDEGRPFLVMEYVPGTPMDRYCDQQRLSIDDRLRLFLEVCSAVQFAHQNLIVHRDLKPGNILITEEGEPKLLDFGIAKLLAPDTFPQTVLPTAPGLALMTPEYASPEQVAGRPITTTSDVYSLGVLLYELLSGHSPYRLTVRHLDEVRRQVLEIEPKKPSTRVGQTHAASQGAPGDLAHVRATDPRRLRRKLTGDLDTIVLKALRKAPNERYAAVGEFAADLERHLDGRPVRARPDSAIYRTVKFVRRHRVGVAVALTGALVGTAFVVALAIQRAAALDQRDRAELVSEFLTDLFAIPDPVRARGEAITGRELLDRGVGLIDQRLAARPAVRADLETTMGRTYKNLALYPEARELLESALAVRRRHGDRAGEAAVLELLGEVFLQDGDYDSAEPLVREALELRRGLYPVGHRALVESLRQVAGLEDMIGNPNARAHSEEALTLARRLAVRGGTEEQELLALVLDGHGLVLYRAGYGEEAAGAFNEALELYQQLQGDEHPERPTTLNNLALVLQGRDPERAEELLLEALAITEHRYAEARPGLATTTGNLARLLHRSGRLEESEALFKRTLEIQRQVYGGPHPRIAASLNNLALLYLDQARLEDAEELLQEALEQQTSVLPLHHADRAQTLGNLGLARLRRGALDAARDDLEAALAIARTTTADRSQGREVPILSALGEVGLYRGDLHDAEQHFRAALEISRRFDEDSSQLAAALYNLANVVHRKGDFPGARDLYEEALALNLPSLGDEHLEVARIRVGLALVENEVANHPRAEVLARQALAVLEPVLGPRDAWVAATQRALGISLLHQGRFAEAEAPLLMDFEFSRGLEPTPGTRTHRAADHLAQLYEGWGRARQAAPYRRLAEAWEGTR